MHRKVSVHSMTRILGQVWLVSCQCWCCLRRGIQRWTRCPCVVCEIGTYHFTQLHLLFLERSQFVNFSLRPRFNILDNDLHRHGCIETDASLSRADAFINPNNIAFNETIYQTLASSNPGVDYYNTTSAGATMRARLDNSIAINPELVNGDKEITFRSTESALYLLVLGDDTAVAPKKYVRAQLNLKLSWMELFLIDLSMSYSKKNGSPTTKDGLCLLFLLTVHWLALQEQALWMHLNGLLLVEIIRELYLLLWAKAL